MTTDTTPVLAEPLSTSHGTTRPHLARRGAECSMTCETDGAGLTCDGPVVLYLVDLSEPVTPQAVSKLAYKPCRSSRTEPEDALSTQPDVRTGMFGWERSTTATP